MNKTKLTVVDVAGKSLSPIAVSAEAFAVKDNQTLVSQAVRVYLANQRQGTVSVKTRAEVTGSTKKIWRQKGTGRARHGDRQAPLFVGGGRAHGPKPKDWSLSLNKKMKKQALFSSLSYSLTKKRLLVVDGLEKVKPKSSDLIKILQALKCQVKKKQLTERVLLLTPQKRVESLVYASRNIANLKAESVALVNTYDVLHYQKIIFMTAALADFEKIFLKKSQ